MRENRMKRLLKQGKPVVGCVLSIPEPYVAESLGRYGFDFILIDMQHNPLTAAQLQEMLIALHPSESTVIVRAAWNDQTYINMVLDVGAEGVILPWVNTPEQARAAVSAAKYPPEGRRSWGPRRAGAIYGGDFEEYAAKANDNVLVLPQIEHVEAVKNLDAILTTKGVDGIMIGPADLAFSMGYVTGRSNQQVDDMIQKVLDGCLRHGVPWGMFTGGMDQARKWLLRGGLIATGGSDTGFIAAGAAQMLKEAKALQAEVAAKKK